MQFAELMVILHLMTRISPHHALVSVMSCYISCYMPATVHHLNVSMTLGSYVVTTRQAAIQVKYTEHQRLLVERMSLEQLGLPYLAIESDMLRQHIYQAKEQHGQA